MDFIPLNMSKCLLKLLAVSLLLFWSPVLMAQNTPQDAAGTEAIPARAPLQDRLFFGGNLGLSFGSLTYINVSPTVGVRLTEKVGVGAGPVYSYFEDRTDRRNVYRTEIFGGRLFSQYQAMENVVVYGEYELINMEVPDLLFKNLVRENISSLFIGGGYLHRIGMRSAVSLMVLFNVIESDYVIYENPVIRTGLVIGI